MRAQTILIDADDTLWENNIYFERVIDRYCELMLARGCPPARARETLTAIERRRTRVNGYGVKNFHASLCAACGEVLGPDDHDAELRELASLCAAMLREPPRLIEGVRDTLAHLAGRHRLILFTKGDLDDQSRKLHASGLRRYLHAVDVVKEKDAHAYRDLVQRHGVHLRHGWMVGNSPKSDILPALQVGLGAVFVPHPATWVLEHEELPAEAARLVVLQSFAEMTRHF
jgi:putative hydrolase of the HAD superfamily